MDERDDTKQRARHRDAIHRLAEESGAPETEVGQLYQEELGKMQRVARVNEFLPLLVIRQVKQRLRAHR